MTIFKLKSEDVPGAVDWWAMCDDCLEMSDPAETEDQAKLWEHTCGVPHEGPTPPARLWRPTKYSWTPEEDKIVMENLPKEAAKILGRSSKTVRSHRNRLIQLYGKEAVVPSYRVWSKQDDEIVLTSSIKGAARKLNLSKSTIEWRRRQLRALGLLDQPRSTRRWTAEEDHIVATHTVDEASQLIVGRTPHLIQHRKWKLQREARRRLENPPSSPVSPLRRDQPD